MMYSTPLHLFERAFELRREREWGPRKVARELGIKECTVANWFYRGKRPVVRGSFNADPSQELSYILGVRYGDGTVSTRMLRLVAKDKDFVEKFARCLSRVMGRSYKIYRDCEDRWFTQAYGKPLIDFMRKGLDSHKPFIESYPAEFLRAFFDGEGSVKETKRGKRSYGQVTCSNTNLELMEYVGNLIRRKFSFHPSVWVERRESRKTCYVLAICRGGEIESFLKLVGFSISRKKEKLKRIVQEMESGRASID